MTKVERLGWQRSEGRDALVDREWLVTNGLGGYASGTIGGVIARRYHGLLVAALPNPLGRTMMLSHLHEEVRLPSGQTVRLGAQETTHGLDLTGADHLESFTLDLGVPVWRYRIVGDVVVEKRIFLSNLQNTVYVRYALSGAPGVVLTLRPVVDFRMHDAPVGARDGSCELRASGGRFELVAPGSLPPLRLHVVARRSTFVYEPVSLPSVIYRVEAARGYESTGDLWSPGHFETEIGADHGVTIVASTEPWSALAAMTPTEAEAYETRRRRRLADLATGGSDDPVAAELALAADQFLIVPAGRLSDATRARAEGEELRTVIAGYHWFTDWGRDTMISLEGLTLSTGRTNEARWILNTFAHYVRDGLIPNLFPEGAHEGLYHTADATLWFFHAVGRYVARTDDRVTLRALLPVLEGIVSWHLRGTRFGIRADERDGLLTQGSPHHPLSWMDAKCGDWIVTPRRGKTVEINALWFNALSLLAGWVADEKGKPAAAELETMAARVYASFNERFWNEATGHLYDVVDGESGDDPALRPNQIFAVSLQHAALATERWASVVDTVARRLLTPVGLRSLAPEHPDYKRTYHGDLRTRDGAYHQGTVWSWLIGPFVDAFLRVHPGERRAARELVRGLVAHLGDAGVGSVSEVFDAEAPFTPRGCMAQAWGVAELLRVWQATRPEP